MMAGAGSTAAGKAAAAAADVNEWGMKEASESGDGSAARTLSRPTRLTSAPARLSLSGPRTGDALTIYAIFGII